MMTGKYAKVPCISAMHNCLASALRGIRQGPAWHYARHLCMAKYRSRVSNPDDDDHSAKFAAVLHRLSISLRDAGRKVEALNTSEESVMIYRKITASNSDEPDICFADALHGLSNSLRDVGRKAEALSMSEESVAIERKLASSDPDAFNDRLVKSLHILSDRLRDVDRTADSFRALEEAKEIEGRQHPESSVDTVRELGWECLYPPH